MPRSDLLAHRRRVLAALRRGPVSEAAFHSPNVIDDGPEIGRVAPRIHDLRRRGWLIETHLCGVNSYAEWVLISEPVNADYVLEQPIPKKPQRTTRARGRGGYRPDDVYVSNLFGEAV